MDVLMGEKRNANEGKNAAVSRKHETAKLGKTESKRCEIDKQNVIDES